MILSISQNTVLTENGSITNVNPDEALLRFCDINKPLPWTRYTSFESRINFKKLQSQGRLKSFPLQEHLLVQVNHHSRLKMLANFFDQEYQTWQRKNIQNQMSWFVKPNKEIILNSVSATESNLYITNKLSRKSYDIPMPVHFSLLLDPHFQNQFSDALFNWVELLSRSLVSDDTETYDRNDFLDFITFVLQDMGAKITVCNDANTLQTEDYISPESQKYDFSIMMDPRAGCSIQIQEQLGVKGLQNHVRNLDLDPIGMLQENTKSTKVFKNIIQMHMQDIIMLQNKRLGP